MSQYIYKFKGVECSIESHDSAVLRITKRVSKRKLKQIIYDAHTRTDLPLSVEGI